jgi:hypothetical protein
MDRKKISLGEIGRSDRFKLIFKNAKSKFNFTYDHYIDVIKDNRQVNKFIKYTITHLLYEEYKSWAILSDVTGILPQYLWKYNNSYRKLKIKYSYINIIEKELL